MLKLPISLCGIPTFFGGSGSCFILYQCCDLVRVGENTELQSLIKDDVLSSVVSVTTDAACLVNNIQWLKPWKKVETPSRTVVCCLAATQS